MVYLLPWLLLWLLLRVLRLHLAVANVAGSPDPVAPLVIKDPTIAQAFYGRLDDQRTVDHYSFEAAPQARLRPILLLLADWYDRGLRASVTISGPGLPPEGLMPEGSGQRMTIAGRDYVLAQSTNQPLAGGRYLVAVRRDAGAGAYAFCVGDREGSYADTATRAQVDALIGGREP